MTFFVKSGSIGLIRPVWTVRSTDMFKQYMLKPGEGKKIGVVDFQKRKAGAKCLEPGVTITCPDNCFGCDPALMAGQVTNQNGGNPFPIVAECINTKNKKRSKSHFNEIIA